MNRLLTRGLTLAATLATASTLLADPPANDNLANAQVLEGDEGTVSANNEEATYENAWRYKGSEHTIWYKWTAPANSTATFDTLGSSFDTVLDIYTGTGYADFVQVGRNDDWDGAESRVTFSATQGVTYYIMLGGYRSSRGDAVLNYSPKPFKILAENGIVTGFEGSCPETIAASDFPAGVTNIANHAFNSCDSLESVTFPAGLLSIGEWAFNDCYNLTSLVLPEGLLSIGEYAFAECEELETLTVPASVTSIGDKAFSLTGVKSVTYEGDVAAITVSDSAFVDTPYGATLPFKLLTRSETKPDMTYTKDDEGNVVIISNNVEYTQLYAFIGTCPAEVTIPEGVTTIAGEAFSCLGNENLAKVILPSTLKTITITEWYPQTESWEDEETGEIHEEIYWYSNSRTFWGIDSYAFEDCDALAEVVNMPAKENVSDYAFRYSLYERVRPFELVTYESTSWVNDYDSEGNYIGEHLVTNIWVSGFYGTCPAEVVIPEGIYGVAENAFSLNRGGDGPWKSAENLTKVTLPSSLKQIYGFKYLPNLTQVVLGWDPLGENAPYIDSYAFCGAPVFVPKVNTSTMTLTGFCGAAADVVIPEGVKTIGSYVFSAHNHIKSVTLPKSLETIEYAAFRNCEKLETVTFLGNKDAVTIASEAFAGTLYYDTITSGFELATKWSVDYDYSTDSTVSNLWVTGCTGYNSPETLVIPDGVYGIEGDAFNCDLENTVAVTIPASVKYIESYAFSYNPKLATVTFAGNKDDIDINDTAFVGTPFAATLPFKPLYWIDSDGYWQYDSESGEEYWVSTKFELHIYGYIGTCPATLDLATIVNGVEDEEGETVTSVVVSKGAFAGAATLVSVVPPACEYHASGAFAETGLPFAFEYDTYAEVNLASEVIEDFNGYDHYVTNTVKGIVGYTGTVPETLVIPDEAQAIGESVFSGCENLVAVTIPDSVKSIDEEAFSECYNLATVTIGAGVEYIGRRCFAECDALTEFYVPGNVKEICPYVFEDDYNLKYVTFAEGVQDIGYYAFLYCQDGIEVTLPYSASANIYPSDQFAGIEGTVHVLAPHGTHNQIWNRNVYDYDYGEVTTLNVEYYTHVYLDATPGTFEGPADYLSVGDFVTGLPVPVLEGYGLRAWVDEDGDRYENGDTWNEWQHEARLTALWGKLVEPGPDGLILIGGEPYGEENLAKITTAEIEQEGRHGKNFLYWIDAAGNLVTADTIISEEGDNTLFSVWETFNPLADGEDSVDAAKAQVYNGYVLDAAGDTVGTLQVKVGKPNKKTGLASVSATVQLLGAKKLTFKATENKGKATIAADGSTKNVTLSCKNQKDMTFEYISEDGVFGAWNGYELVASRDTSKLKTATAAYNKWVSTVEVVFDATNISGAGAAFGEGYTTFQVNIAKKGKVKVSGVLPDGTKVSSSCQLLVSEDAKSACANVFITSNKCRFGFILWLLEDGTCQVESVTTLQRVDKKAGFTAEVVPLDVAKLATPSGTLVFDVVDELPTQIAGADVLTEVGGHSVLPDGVQVTVGAKGKLVVPKAGGVKAKKGTLTITGSGDNTAGLKVSYTAKTGQLKGSFTLYTWNGKKLKKQTATLTGAVVNGKGYGTAVIKKVGSFAFQLQ